jgi:hypothetical protein
MIFLTWTLYEKAGVKPDSNCLFLDNWFADHQIPWKLDMAQNNVKIKIKTYFQKFKLFPNMYYHLLIYFINKEIFLFH